jgi:uncharacterized RDD family membrane protein YckC
MDLVLSPQKTDWPPDPSSRPNAYRGVTLRRILAYLIDGWIIFLILLGVHLLLAMLTVVTLGLFWPLHILVVPLAVALPYHSLQTSSSAAATLGMRLFGLKVHSVLGGRPSLGQALVHTVCFYLTLGLSGGLLLLFALFNRERRTLHDLVAGLVVLRQVVP